jgi:hypothetical protein
MGLPEFLIMLTVWALIGSYLFILHRWLANEEPPRSPQPTTRRAERSPKLTHAPAGY